MMVPFEDDWPGLETDDLIDAWREWNDLCVLMSLENGPLLVHSDVYDDLTYLVA